MFTLDNLISLLPTIAALLVGSFAFVIYSKQKKDEKINAAKIILAEFKNAEQKVDEVAEFLDRGANDFPKILTKNSWNQFSYLFASDFKQNQLEEISRFYSLCETLQEMVDKDNNYVWLAAGYRTQVVQEKLYELALKCFDEEKMTLDKKKLEIFKQKLLTEFTNDQYIYAPLRTLNKMKMSISKIRKLSNTPIGEKLEKIAELDLPVRNNNLLKIFG